MAGETNVTIIGNLVDAPDLRFTQSGKPVANLTIASTPRSFDRQSGEWRDGDALFMRCTVWGNAGAENIAECLNKGDRVIAYGSIGQRSFETRDGEKRTVIEMTVEEIGPSAKWATVSVNRASRSGGGQQRGQYDDGEQWGSQRRERRPQQGQRGSGGYTNDRSGGGYDDPWGSAPPPSGQQGAWDDEIPF